MLGPILRWTHQNVKTLRRSQRTTLGYLVAGLIRSGRAGVAAIGRGVPGRAYGKHKIKRVDRFLGNARVDLAALSRVLLSWAACGDGQLVLALDWTDLPGSSKKMLSLAVPTRGRALPVHCRVVDERRMHKSQNWLEEGLLVELKTLVPFRTRVVIVADRGFGRARLMQRCRALGVSFVLRVEGRAMFRHRGTRQAVNRVPLRRGQTVQFRDVSYRDEQPVPAHLVLTWRRRMKEPWYLATDLDLQAAQVIGLYGRRMQIEESFRDVKSVRWGFKLRHVRLSECRRYERLMMVVALATLFLLSVGARAERDRRHRRWMANTSRRRTLSWLMLGRMCWEAYGRQLGSCVRLLQPAVVLA